METPQLTLKFLNEQGEISAISVLLYLCMIAEQFDFAYEIISISKEPDGDVLNLQPYRPQRYSGQQFSHIDMADDNEQIAEMLVCEDDTAGRKSTRSREGQKELYRLCAQFSINGGDLKPVVEPKTASRAALSKQAYDTPPRIIPFELNCLDLKRNQLLIQEKSQTAVSLDAKFSAKVGSALKELNAQIEIHKVFDGQENYYEILNYSGREISELLSNLFSRAAELYVED